MWCPFNWNARDAFFDAATCQRAQGVSAHQSGQYFNRDLMSSGLGCVEHHTKQTATTVALVSHSNGSARQRPSRWRTYVECKHFKKITQNRWIILFRFLKHTWKKKCALFKQICWGDLKWCKIVNESASNFFWNWFLRCLGFENAINKEVADILTKYHYFLLAIKSQAEIIQCQSLYLPLHIYLQRHKSCNCPDFFSFL